MTLVFMKKEIQKEVAEIISYMNVCLGICIYVYKNTQHKKTYIYIYVWAYMYMCMCIYIYVCVCV